MQPTYSPQTTRILGLLALLIIALWTLVTPPGILGKADAVGYAICHRIAERTFHVHDRPLPLCARCTGIYLGILVGLGLFAARGRLRAAKFPPLPLLAIVIGVNAFYVVDGVNSYFSLFESYRPIYQPHNTLRLITGTGFGLAMITLVLPMFNMILWRRPPQTAPLRNLLDLLILYVAAAGVIVLVLLEQPAILIAAGLLSAAGVLLMFGIVGCIGFLTLAGGENTLETWRDLQAPALAGLIFAFLVIGGIDLARYLLTGTWDGFVF